MNIGCERRQSLVVTFRPTEGDDGILAFNEACFAHSLATAADLPGARLLRKPITGIACCARAASGHVTAAPPSSAMNSRRFS